MPDNDPTAAPSAKAVAAIRQMSLMAPVTVSNPADIDIASGRGLTYEWEFIAAGIYDRVDTLEQTTPSSGGAAIYLHTQSSASSTWSIAHNLNTVPDVVVVDAAGQQLLAEIHYPDSNHAVVVHGSPYAGSAYLRG